MTAVTRPVFRWHGSKWRLAPWILDHFPAHRVYVEPFGGAASVLLQKPPMAAEVYNDLDGTAVNVFRVLRDPAKGAELKRRLALTPWARAEFEWSYGEATDDLDEAHRTIVRSFMGYGSDAASRTCRTGFRAKLSDERAVAAWSWRDYPGAVDSFIARLRGVVIEQRPALEILARYDTPGTLFYVDPPYLHSTRSSLTGRSARTHGYAHEMTDADHQQLIERLRRVKGMVVLSGYPSPIYEEQLGDWRRVTCQALADGARPRTEVLWINAAASAKLSRGARQLLLVIEGGA